MINILKKTQKELFFYYLEERNLLMLKSVLPSNAEYFGVSKKEFLKKLSYIDNQITLAGSIEKFTILKHKKHINTYYLKTPIIEFRNKFIVEENEGKIIKIYNQYIKEDKHDIDSSHPLEIFFGDDYKIDFKPCHCYIKNLYKCNKAFKKLVNNTEQNLTVNDILLWVTENAKLYDEVKRDYLMFRFNNFKNLYRYLKLLIKELKNLKNVQKAMNTYSHNDLYALKKWLNDYNELAFQKINSFEDLFKEIDLSKDIFKSSLYSNIIFKGSEFQKILKFNELYSENLKQIKSTSANSGLQKLGFGS